MMPEPGLLDLRRVAKGMSTYYAFAGKQRLLSLQVVEGNNRHKGTGQRQAVFYRVMLTWGDGHSDCWHIGSHRFNYVYKRRNNHQELPKAVWLFLDMMHLIMLLAKRTKANMDVVKFWFQEAKVFLMGMVKNTG